MAQSAESLVEERVTQLQEISKRRNELLREMYHLIQKRDNLGSVIAIDEDANDGLQVFLDRFDLEKYPDTGHIDTLLEDEIAIPETPPAYSPVGGPELELKSEPEPGPGPEPEHQSEPEPEYERESEAPAETDPEPEPESVAHDVSESSISEPPASPPPTDQGEETETLQYADSSQAEVPMDVDEGVPAPTDHLEQRSEEQEVVEQVTSPEPSQGMHTAPQSPAPPPEDLHPTEEMAPEKVPTPAQERPLTPASYNVPARESPVAQSPTVSAVATREPSVARVSPPREERVPSPVTWVVPDEGVVKAEPLDNEVMEDIEMQVQEEAPSLPVVAQDASQYTPTFIAPSQLSKTHSEDQIMAILGPSQTRMSPVPYVDHAEAHQAHVDYSIPLPTLEPSVSFSFAGRADELMELAEPAAPPELFGPEPPYPLPPANLLPLEFSRRKASKRKRDKEKGEGKEWQPMPLNKWAALLKTNPVHTKLTKAPKCLNTRDWSVGMLELRLVRVFERIERLKEANAWSFRQPRKQRGVGGLTKTHWDYLMDEMKWMRTDFREERRWKLALAYNLAHAVVEWHEAGSLDERIRRGVVVLWKPPPQEDTEMVDASEEVDGPFRDAQDTDENGVDSRETETPMDGYASDDESEDDQDKDQQDAVDTLAPASALQEALQQLEDQTKTSNAQPDSQENVSLKPKIEEIEDLSALGENHNTGSQDPNANAMEVDGKKADGSEGQKAAGAGPSKQAAPETHHGLKSSSKNPVLTAHGKEGDGAHVKSKHKGNQYAALRERILHSAVDKLFIDLDDLDLVKGMSELSTDDPQGAAAAPPPPPPNDLAAIFPDLIPYGMLDIAPPQEIRKKSERKSDRDDPNKRAEDTTYTKLAPVSKFMHVKPVLVGTLKPASHFKDREWSQVEETPWFADVDVPPARPLEENPCSLFEGATTKSNAPNPSFIPGPPRDVRKRNADHHNDIVWTPAEDAHLKQAVERYAFNWALIAEFVNSNRVTIKTDKRTRWECQERWREKLSAQARADAAEENSSAAASTSAAASHMTTRGLKRSANQAVASGSGSGGSSTLTEPRKRRRHAAMHDTLRKAAKKREAQQKNNAPRAKPSVVHDTHGQYSKLPKLTPAELSRMKAEKEAREAHEIAMRRRNDELTRQHLIREQQQRAAGLPPAAPQAPQQSAQLLPQTPGANGVPRPANGVPQAPVVQSIRSQVGISQQQQQSRLAAAAALANAGARMSPSNMQAMRALAQAQLQNQAQAQTPVQAQAPQVSSASAALNAAAPALSAAHLSPSFAARATSSSPGVPHQSPPLPAASPANVARPPPVPGQPVQSSVNPLLHSSMLQYVQQLQGQFQGQFQGRLSQEQQLQILAQEAQQHFQRQQQQHQQQQHQAQQQQQYAAHVQQPQAQNSPNGNFPHS